MLKKFFWKIWLRLNTLVKGVGNDYIAEISTVGHTLHNEDIAQIIVNGRSELRFETILGILRERDAAVRQTILNGASVQDENIRISPRLLGGWIGIDPVFDPKKHKFTFDAVATVEFRKALDEEIGIEILGKKTDGGAVIGLVTDVKTGKTDGTITFYDNIIISGSKIKVAPDDDPQMGVFLVYPGGDETRFEMPFVENNPKRIVCRVPDVLNGTYTLKIVTRFAASATLLKEPRTIIYNIPVKVVS
jgi:hypothetical protein